VSETEEPVLFEAAIVKVVVVGTDVMVPSVLLKTAFVNPDSVTTCPISKLCSVALVYKADTPYGLR
jgi:hypothetical protein